MNKFKQHIPNFINVDKSPDIEFKATEDLLGINVVKQWYEPVDGKPFSHFAISGNRLIVVHDNCFSWWVVGYIKYPELVKLPKWVGGKYRAELSDGSRVELTSKEVVSSCGNILTLKDGSNAKNIKKP